MAAGGAYGCTVRKRTQLFGEAAGCLVSSQVREEILETALSCRCSCRRGSGKPDICAQQEKGLR